MVIKLSKTQLELLDKLKTTNSTLCYMGYLGRFNEHPYYFISKTLEHVRISTVNKLVKLGYLRFERKKGEASWEGIAVLTGKEWGI